MQEVHEISSICFARGPFVTELIMKIYSTLPVVAPSTVTDISPLLSVATVQVGAVFPLKTDESTA